MLELSLDNKYFTKYDVCDNRVVDSLKKISNIITKRERCDFDLIVEICRLSKKSEFAFSGYINDLRFVDFTYGPCLCRVGFFDLLFDCFGFSRKTVEMLCYIGYKFIDWSVDTPKWKIDLFNDMSIYKIAELRSLKDIDEVNKFISEYNISARMTQKELRCFVKEFKINNKSKSVPSIGCGLSLLIDSMNNSESGVSECSNKGLESHFNYDVVVEDIREYCLGEKYDRKYLCRYTYAELLDIIILLQDKYISLFG